MCLLSAKSGGDSGRDLCKLGAEVTHLSITEEYLYVSSGSDLRIFRLSILSQEEPPVRTLRLQDLPNIKLLSPIINYF